MKGWLQYSKRGGMSLVIKKLNHPKKLTYKNYNKEKRMRLCLGFHREREDFFFKKNFLKLSSSFFLLIFLAISLFFFSTLFPIFPLFFSYSSSYFSQKLRGIFIRTGGKWGVSISVLGYTGASPVFKGEASW